MAELTSADVETYTRGRLSGTDPVVADMLDAALVRARQYVKWPVSPERTETVTLDGPGQRILQLPTRRLTTLTSITENSAAVDVAKLEWSELGKVRKLSGATWTCRYRGIVAEITHGYTEAEAADWRRAILSMVDRMSREQQTGARSDDDLVRKHVDDVEYQWVDWSSAAGRAITSVEAVLDAYALDLAYLV